MAAPILSLAMLGQQFTFRSKNANDSNVYEGTITRFCTADDAQKVDNIVIYNQGVRQTDPSVPADVTQLKQFFVLHLSNTVGSKNDYVFAPEWIVDGSFTALSPTDTVTIEVIDAQSNNHQLILDTLMAAGYLNCSIVSTVSNS